MSNPSDTPQPDQCVDCITICESNPELLQQHRENKHCGQGTPQTQTAKQVLTELVANVNKWDMYVPSAEADGEIHAALAAIQSLVEGVIGYEEYPDKAQDVTYDIMVRSGLRAEQRQALQTIMGTIKR